MKLYRFIEKPEDEYFLKKGWGNEFINLTEYQKISPSLFDTKDALIPTKKANTFAISKELNKYFFASLTEIILYAFNRQDKELRRGIYSDYLIMEVDIPDEIAKQYMGLGFYNYGDNFVEARVPYEVLYEKLGINEAYVSDAINVYNNKWKVNNQRFLEQCKSLEIKYPKELFLNNITKYIPFNIYPLLCFNLESNIKIFQFGNIKDTYQEFKEYYNIANDLWNKREQQYKYKKEIDAIVGSKEGTVLYNANYSQDALYDFTLPIIVEENQSLKRVLKK